MGPIRAILGFVRDKIRNRGQQGRDEESAPQPPPQQQQPGQDANGAVPPAQQQQSKPRKVGALRGVARAAATGGSAQRHNAAEDFMLAYGRVFSWLPFVLVLAVAPTNNLAATWSAFGLCLLLNILDAYRARYNDAVEFPMVINFAQMLAYLINVILAYEVFNQVGGGGGYPDVTNTTNCAVVTCTSDNAFNFKYIGPIVVSCIAACTLGSILVCHPFTMQMSGPRVSPEVRKSAGFFKANMIISVFWVALFGIMCIFVWTAILFSNGSAGQIVLGTVLPILTPVAGFLTTPYLVAWLKRKGEERGEGQDGPQPPPPQQQAAGADADAVGAASTTTNQKNAEGVPSASLNVV